MSCICTFTRALHAFSVLREGMEWASECAHWIIAPQIIITHACIHACLVHTGLAAPTSTLSERKGDTQEVKIFILILYKKIAYYGGSGADKINYG